MLSKFWLAKEGRGWGSMPRFVKRPTPKSDKFSWTNIYIGWVGKEPRFRKRLLLQHFPLRGCLFYEIAMSERKWWRNELKEGFFFRNTNKTNFQDFPFTPAYLACRNLEDLSTAQVPFPWLIHLLAVYISFVGTNHRLYNYSEKPVDNKKHAYL